MKGSIEFCPIDSESVSKQETNGWINCKCTFEEVGFALAVGAEDDIDAGVEIGDGLVFVGLEIVEQDGLHNSKR